MKFKAAALCSMAFGLVACSAPLVSPDLPTFQAKVGHVNDWSILASETASNFAAHMSDKTRPIYVAPGPADMPFASAFRKQLEQELLQRHFDVMQTVSTGAEVGKDGSGEPLQVIPPSPVVLRFEVQTFWYKNDDDKHFVDYASFWTTAYALGAQLRHVSSLDTGAGIAAAAGPVFDVLTSMDDTTKAEALLTLTVADTTRLYYSHSQTVYIHPTELPFYWTHVPDFAPPARSGPLVEATLPVRPSSVTDAP